MTCPNCVELCNWVAVYADGTRISECDGQQHHAFAEVDRTRLVEVAWEPNRDGVERVAAWVSPETAAVVRVFRRRSVELNLDTGGAAPRPTIHGLGWDGNYWFVMPTGQVIRSNDLNGVWV